MLRELIIVKIGGKILKNPKDLKSTISQLDLLCEKRIIQNIIIIPGGGSYANFVRFIDDKLKIGDDLSHWMAIYAMNQNGKDLCEKYPKIRLLDNFNELKNLTHELNIFLPFNFLYQTDELPHSWNVTSDSITLYLAHKLELDIVYLIKDIDGIKNDKNQIIKEISTSEYSNFRDSDLLAKIHEKGSDSKKSQPIDFYILKLINDFKISCIILNGTKDNQKILHYFNSPKDYEKIYTKIRYE